MTEAGNILIKSILGSLSDDELMELAKPIDEVNMDNLPTLKRVLGLREQDDKYGK